MRLAVQLRRMAAVEVLCEKVQSFSELDYELPRASRNGDLKMVKLLLSKLSWNGRERPWASIKPSLRSAVKRGHDEMVDAILAAIPSKF